MKNAHTAAVPLPRLHAASRYGGTFLYRSGVIVHRTCQPQVARRRSTPTYINGMIFLDDTKP